MSDRVNLIFIGSDFYHNSGTVMSSIYTDGGDRFDWGFVQVALCNGKEVHIRPATKDELVPFQQRLEEIQRRRMPHLADENFHED